MTTLATMTVEEAARAAAGNWRRFNCFAWFRQKEIDRPDDWSIFYTHHRDSGLIDLSNAGIIRKELEPFADSDDPDVVFETHSSWLVGWMEGFSLRVFKRGRLTKAFRVWHELQERMDTYPILDESDYSEREFNATLENISLMAWRLAKQFTLPEGWECAVYDWLSQHNDSALENTDDQGGCPSEDEIEEAFVALGYARID